MASKSLTRIGQKSLAQPIYSLGTRNGTIPLISATQHNFRDRNKLQDISSYDISNKTYIFLFHESYLPDKERACKA